MDIFDISIVHVIILLFLLITFLQSGLDKLLDWNGNVSWLKEHFAATFLSKLVPFSLALILIIELITSVCCVIGLYMLIKHDNLYFTSIAMLLSCITLLMLLFGQRIAKDYQGALTITCYFIVAVFGLYCTLSNV